MPTFLPRSFPSPWSPQKYGKVSFPASFLEELSLLWQEGALLD